MQSIYVSKIKMIKKLVLLLILLATGASFVITAHQASASAENRYYVVLVVDGLRPDYVTQGLMPNLYALGEQGVFADRHHPPAR